MILRLCLMLACSLASLARADDAVRAGEFEQRLGGRIPPHLSFQNESGQAVAFDSILARGQPILLSLVYFHCQTLCPLVLNGLTRAINDMPDEATKPFQLVIVSVDPKDTAPDAAERKNLLLKRSRSLLQASNLHMLRGEEPAIRQLADAIGFHYQRDAKTGQYEHPSGLVVLTSDGRIARYFFGIDFDPGQLRTVLQKASQNRLDHLIQKIRLACFRYNAETGTYTLAIYKIMRVFAVILLIAGGLAIGLWEHRRLQPK